MGSLACHVGGLADSLRESAALRNYLCMFHHRRLPHWHPEGRPVFLTWHLKGSLPQNRYPPAGALSAGKAFVWMDRFLDTACRGPFWLRREPIAALAVDAIEFGERELEHYDVGAFVVMPNHVHLLVTPRAPIEKLTRRLKGYTAWQANRMLGRTGEAFWQRESYDHWGRSAEEWARIARYIENNPVAAGLAAKPEEYRWSSAGVGHATHRQDCRRGRQDCPLHIEDTPHGA